MYTSWEKRRVSSLFRVYHWDKTPSWGEGGGRSLDSSWLRQNAWGKWQYGGLYLGTLVGIIRSQCNLHASFRILGGSEIDHCSFSCLGARCLVQRKSESTDGCWGTTPYSDWTNLRHYGNAAIYVGIRPSYYAIRLGGTAMLSLEMHCIFGYLCCSP